MDGINDGLFNAGSIDEGLDVPTETSTIETGDKGSAKRAKVVKPKPKTHEATVIFCNKGKLGVDFQGFGVMLFTEKIFSAADKVLVGYDGNIGSPDFKCWLT